MTILLLFLSLLVGCKLTLDLHKISERCLENIKYLQTHKGGITPMLDKNGNVIECKKE